MNKIICASLLAVAPTLAVAEEQYVQIFNCEVTQECSQEGKCDAKSELIVFSLTEKNVQRHGEGTYEISYSGTTTLTQMLTPYGPMMWRVDDEDIQTLTSIGEPDEATGSDFVFFMTWSRQLLSKPPKGTVKFLRCKDE